MSRTIASLQREINDNKYQLLLIDRGLRPKRGIKSLGKRIEILRATIKEIKANKKKAT